ncbi:MAG: hypothetical protein PHV42_00205 [Candidatus Pacebacteria bacterium]|nr:hypothetical protein [Candidatus Paceibacterota bacterium]
MHRGFDAIFGELPEADSEMTPRELDGYMAFLTLITDECFENPEALKEHEEFKANSGDPAWVRGWEKAAVYLKEMKHFAEHGA